MIFSTSSPVSSLDLSVSMFNVFSVRTENVPWADVVFGLLPSSVVEPAELMSCTMTKYYSRVSLTSEITLAILTRVKILKLRW